METVEEIAQKLRIDAIEERYWNFALPLILKVQSEGASFFIKADGGRESDIFTIMIEGGPLSGDYLRCETSSLQDGLNEILSDYSKRFWS